MDTFPLPNEHFKIPSYADIPQSVKDRVSLLPARDKHHRLMVDWFYNGLSSLTFVVKPHISVHAGIQSILSNLLSNRSISHEHKAAAFVWCCDNWFEDVTWVKQ